MREHDSPYEYAGERPDGGLDDGDGPEDETVIVDGDAMSYRRYRHPEQE